MAEAEGAAEAEVYRDEDGLLPGEVSCGSPKAWASMDLDPPELASDPFEQADTMLYDSPKSWTGSLASAPSAAARRARGALADCWGPLPPPDLEGSQSANEGDAFEARSPRPPSTPSRPSRLPRPQSAPLLRSSGGAAALGEMSRAATEAARREELKAELKKQFGNRVRSILQGMAATTSKEEQEELVRKKRLEARKAEARQRQIIAKAVERGASRERDFGVRSASVQAQATAAGGLPDTPAPGAGAPDCRPGSPSRPPKPRPKMDNPEYCFEKFRSILEGAFERPLLIERQAQRKLTHYEVLGVEPSASTTEIRARYEARCEAEEQRQRRQPGEDRPDWEAVVEAYNTLVDPRKRREYDEACGIRGSGARSLLAEKLEAEILEKAKEMRLHMRAVEREQWQDLQEVVAKGAAKSTMLGSHKVRPHEGWKSLAELVEEKKAEMEHNVRNQRAKLREIKAQVAARIWDPNKAPKEDPCPPPRRNPSAERYAALIAERVAEKKQEALLADRVQRLVIQEAVARGLRKSGIPKPQPLCAPGGGTERRPAAELAAEKRAEELASCKAQWAHINEIKARVAARGRQF